MEIAIFLELIAVILSVGGGTAVISNKLGDVRVEIQQNKTTIKNLPGLLKGELQNIIDEKIEEIEDELNETKEDISRLDSRVAQLEGWAEANNYRIRKVD